MATAAPPPRIAAEGGAAGGAAATSVPAAPAPPQAPPPNPEELSRKYKRLETNKKDWAEQAQKELKRLKNEVTTFKKENEHLKQLVAQQQGSPFGPSRGQPQGTAVGMAPASAGSSGKRIQRVREMEQKRDQIAALEQKVQADERKMEDMDAKIGTTKAKVHRAREDMGGVNITKQSNLMIEKQIKVLENRLDKALVKFNEALHINKELREQIDNLRRERGVFDTIYKKLERELQEKKKEMAFIIEVSNIAYEERDNAQNELGQLKLYAAKEMQSFEETFKELDELLEEDRKMKEAIKQRMAERKDRPDTTRAAPEADDPDGKRKKGAVPGPQPKPGTLTHPASGQMDPMSPQSYEDAFNKIKAATKMSDINQLVNRFLHAEDDNFSLFNYVNELNNEIEKLEDARNEIRSELDRVKGNTGAQQGDQNRKQVLKQLEDKLQVEMENSKKYHDMADKTSKLLEQALVCVDKIFNTLECDESKIIEAQGTAGLSENNIHLYLASIELKADEYLLRWRRIHGAPERGPQFPFGSTNITIDIPSTGDEVNEGYSDEEERVLTREELLLKTNRKISHQQAVAVQKGPKIRGKRKPGYASGVAAAS